MKNAANQPDPQGDTDWEHRLQKKARRAKSARRANAEPKPSPALTLPVLTVERPSPATTATAADATEHRAAL